MTRIPEYKSPWESQNSPNAEDQEKAGRSFERLLSSFTDPESRRTNFPKLFTSIKKYYYLSVRAAAEGLAEGEREAYIQEGLRQDGLVDVTDRKKAQEQYDVLSQGYELNRGYFNEKLGRGRKYKANLG